VTAGPATDPDTLRRDITREIARLAGEAGSRAIGGETATAEVDRIKELQSVLAALPHRESFPLRWGAIIGALCLIVVSLLWTIRIPQTRLQLDLATTSITVRLKDDFSWDGNWRLNPEQVRLQHFTHLDLPPEYGVLEPLTREASLDLNVSGGSVGLRHLFVGHGASLTIASDETGATDMVVREAPFRGDLDVSGTVAGSAGPTPVTSLPPVRFDPDMPPGRFGFQYDGRGALPALLHLSSADTLRFREIAVSGLGFFEERADGTQSSVFASQIVSGTLTITDTGEQIPLVPAAALLLADAGGLVGTLRVAPNNVRVKFEGTASEVKLGTGDFARDLKPTFLEWFFHQQKLGFFWGAITFLWGMAWGARKFFSGN